MGTPAAAGNYRLRVLRMTSLGGRVLRPGAIVSTPRLGVAIRLAESGRATPADRRTADDLELSVWLRAIDAGAL